MLGDLTGQQLTFLAILAAAVALLLIERVGNDVVAVLIILALSLTGLLKPSEALAGFGRASGCIPSRSATPARRRRPRARRPSASPTSCARGAPLTAVVAAVVVLLAPLLWRG